MSAVMLPVGILQHVLRAHAIIDYERHQEIESWDDLPADRVDVTDITIDGCSEETSYSEFRFLKRDLHHLCTALRFHRVVLDNNSVIPGEKGLKWMAYLRRLVDLEGFFGRDYSTISRCFKYVVNKMDEDRSHLLADNLAFFCPVFRSTIEL